MINRIQLAKSAYRLSAIIAFLLVNTGICFSQNLDSMENVLKTRKVPIKEQLDLYDDLSWGYLNLDLVKSKLFSRKGIDISTKNKIDKSTGIFYHHLGIAYYKDSKTDSALFYLKTAESFSRKANDESRLNNIYIAYAIVYETTGDYEKAISINLNLLPRLEKQNKFTLIRTVYGNIGTLYLNIHNYNLAEKYFQQSAKLCIEKNDDWRLSQAYNGLTNVFTAKKEYKKALGFANKALEVAYRCGDVEGQALTYQKISEIYYSHYKDFDKALQIGLKGMNIAKNSCTVSDMAAMQVNLSNIYYQKNDYKNSLFYALEAIQSDTTDIALHENVAANIVKSAIFLNDKRLSIRYFDKFYNIVESRSKKELHRFSVDSEKKYQTEKKELEITVLQKQRRLSIIIFVASTVVLILILLTIYYRFLITKRNKQIAEQRISQLEQEKQLVATQSILEGENAERTRLARDLHDGLGGMLSAIKINLFDMKQGVTLEVDDVSRLNRVFNMLDESMKELRRVAHNMMPESLSRYGLKVALADFCSNFSQVQFHYFGNEQRIDPKTEIMLYRIVHELINNAIKHAEASSINVQLVQESDRISLNVYDDGKGFDKTIAAKGTGLKNITDRVYSLGGNIDINTEPDKGTEISIEIKL